MSRAAERVRCYNCGRPGPRDAPGCARCGATYGALCGCGAELSVFDDECPKCGTGHVPKRVPSAKLPHVRAAKWTALVLAVGAVAWIAWARYVGTEQEVWRIKLQVKEAFNASDYETAARLSRQLTEVAAPRDAEGFYLLAATYRALKFPPDVYMGPAKTAVLYSDDYFDARDLLAKAELELGHLDRAIFHAEKAAKSPNANANAWMLLARLELMKPRPDLAGAQAALEHARTSGRDTTEVKALLAEVTMRLHGAIAGAGRLQPRGAATLRTALAALETAPPGDRDGATISLTKARILLALGEAEPAFTQADRALSQLPPDAPSAAIAEVGLVRALALHMRGNKVEAMAALAEVLRAAPAAATASAASSYLVNAGDAAAARGLLSSAADTHDPAGAIHAVLATVLLAQDAVDDAARAIEAARVASPNEPFFAEIMGTVRVAQGRFAEARAAFDEASRLAPALVEPHVRRALVVLAEAARTAPGSGPAAAAATRAACEQALADLEQLRTKFGDDPFLLEGIGRMNLSLGDIAAARAALEAAAQMWPADPDIWIALAEARRRSGDGESLAAAAAAWGRARVVRPDDASIALAEAQAWTDAGKYEVAVSACTEFLRRHPDADAVLRARAACYVRLEMWSLAATDLRRLADRPDSLASDLEALVGALYRAGDARAAKQAAQDAKGKVPAHVLEFLAALYGGDAEGAIARLAEGGPSLLLAEIQLAAGRADDSMATLRRMDAAQPGDPSVARLLVAELLGPEPVPPERIAESRALLAALAPGSPPGVARLIEGRILLAESKDADAVAPLREAEQSLPDDALAALFLGEALFRGGDRAESLAKLRRAAALPSPFWALRTIVADRLLQASGGCRDLDRAESLSREAMRLDPNLAGAALRTVDLLHARGDFAQAADVAERALRLPGLAPGDVMKLRLAAAFEHLLAGEFQATEIHVDAMTPAERESPGGRLLTAYAELGAGRTDAARRTFEALLAADPGNAPAAVGLLRADLAKGDLAAVSARVDAWVATHPGDRDVSLVASRLLLRAGYADGAVRLAAACAARHPADFVVAVNRATVLRRAGRGAEAVGALRAFAESRAAPDATAARLALATVSVQCAAGVPEALAAAREIAQDAAQPEPARLEAEVIEAEALAALGRLAEAETAAQTVLARLDAAPAGGRERILKSRAHFVQGFAAASATPMRRTVAVDAFVRCLDLDRDNLDVANALAWVMAQDADAAAAAQALALARKVTAAAPGDGNYWDTRAEAARHAGEFADAEASWTRSLELCAAAARRDLAREARIALRFAGFLRGQGKQDAARRVVERLLPAVAGTAAERELEKFLKE